MHILTAKSGVNVSSQNNLLSALFKTNPTPSICSNETNRMVKLIAMSISTTYPEQNTSMWILHICLFQMRINRVLIASISTVAHTARKIIDRFFISGCWKQIDVYCTT